MKKIILLIFIANSIIAQNISYHVSEDFTDIKSKFDFGIFEFNNNTFGNVYYLKGDCFKIQLFDSTFNKVIKEETVTLPEQCKKANNAVFKKYKNNFYCFYTTLQNKVGTLYALTFDTKTLKFSPESKKLFEVNDIQKGAFSGEFRYSPNTDSSLILVQYFKEYLSKGDFNNSFATIGYVIFDNKLNNKYATEIQYPYRIGDDSYTTTSSHFNKNGEIFILTSVKLNNSIDGMDITENKTLTRLELLKLNQKNNTWQKQKIYLEDNKYITSWAIQEDYDNNLLISGSYTTVKPIDLSKLHGTKIPSNDGMYIIKIETNSNQFIKRSSDLIEFPDNVIKMYEDKFRHKSMDKEGNFEFEGVMYIRDFLTKDKGILFVCESKDFLGIFEDVLILKVNQNKKLEYCHKIPRALYLTMNEYERFSYINSNDKDYFFYIDDTGNLNLTEEDKPHGYKQGENGHLICVEIDKNGAVKKSSVFETKSINGKVLPSMFKQLNEYSFIFKSSDKDASKIFKIDIK